ncbi:TPA: hypothetical protein ACSBZ9_002377 [Acinetobacter baumannii]|uniref:beta barrel domain-containing protein n=1 Tax=Acinetobacter baumannii TaxID=470 RepID=UPI00135F6803|nr:hypothetical protein [Acinetobacter baumannii]CAA0280707.1 hypothetical protein AB552B1_03819 [Acinetobacter baumannii]
MLKSELEVGQELYLTRESIIHHSSSNHHVKVTKIARKYAYTTSYYRIDLTNDPLFTERDCTGTRLRVWKSKEEYEEHLRQLRFVSDVKKRVADAKLSYSEALELDKWFEERK